MHNITCVSHVDHHIYYPIGNTPATNLLHYHTPNPENDAATEILLLACGDPRSILYSLWCEGKPGAEKFNFTCCDLEPAVLARNVLLFTLMLDNAEGYATNPLKYDEAKISAIWNLCYHFFVPQQELKMLQDQASKLLDLSEIPEKWAEGPYVSIIKVVSLQTVKELRKMWKLYALKRSKVDQTSYEISRRSEIEAVYNKFYVGETRGRDQTFFPGPHWVKGLKSSNEALYGYWRTGVVAGNEPDIKALGADGKGCVNPLFSISSVSEKFVVHFHSNPFHGFHLTSLFDGSVKDTKAILKAMVDMAKTQFMDWCKAFVEYVKLDSILVNVYYGDAVTFCHELAARNPSANTTSPVTRCYATQWSATPLMLNGDGAKVLPKSFDVIDTSNIADWIGMHNLLPPTSQILSQSSAAILYTETLRLQGLEPEDNLKTELFMDVDLASIIYGIAPMGRLLGYTTDNNSVEDFVHLADNPRRYRMRIPWKVTTMGDSYVRSALPEKIQDHRLSCDAEELSKLFFGVYMKMFESENLEATKALPSGSRQSLTLHHFNPYSRLSFVTLLQQTMRNIKTDWRAFCKSLLENIDEDESLIGIGPGTVVDLILHLDMSGFMREAMGPSPVPGPPHKFVTLVVPRRKLEVFQELGGAPGIHISITRDRSEAHFFSLDCFFGKLKTNGDVVEDSHGWQGTSDLLITCTAPVELVEDGRWQIALSVTLAIGSVQYMLKMGKKNDLVVHKALSDNSRQVRVSDTPPGIPLSRLKETPKTVVPQDSATDQPVTIKAKQNQGSLSFVATYTLTKDTPEAIALGKAEFVTLETSSPCTILLKIGGKYSQRLIFPYPINGAAAKTRIARKSLWIEVTVPIANALYSGGFDTDPFPLDLSGSQPSVWALPRLDLSKQPLIVINQYTGWLEDFHGQILSIREKEKLVTDEKFKSKCFLDDMLLFKKTLDEMMLYIGNLRTDASPPKLKMFVICGQEGHFGEFDMLIIPSCLRHGRETGSIIFDGWFIPVTLERKEIILQMMPQEPGKAITLPCLENERKIWKQLLPAAVESCRRDWKHSANCEYLKTAKAPLSLESWHSPVCSCGEGKDGGEWPKDEWLAPFMQFATRIALPSLSAVSYLEGMEPDIEDLVDGDV